MITRNQSRMIQGIAVSMMLFHHFFLNPNEAEFHFWNVVLTRNIAWFCKIALALYAFVSGYGVFFLFAKCDTGGFWARFAQEYQSVLKKLAILFLQYWFAICVCVGIDRFVYGNNIELTAVLKSALLIDFTYYSTWWYMRQYAEMMLVVPLMDLLLTKFEGTEAVQKRKFYGLFLVVLIVSVIAGICVIPGFFSILRVIEEELHIAVFAPFIVAYLLARYHVYERIADRVPESGAVQVLAGVAVIVLLYLVRTQLATFPAYAKYDFIFAPLFVLGSILALNRVAAVRRILECLGTYCMYMWFVHTFISDWTRGVFFEYSHSPLLFIILEIALSFTFSWILQRAAGILGGLNHK